LSDRSEEGKPSPKEDKPSAEALRNEAVRLLQEKEELIGHICPSVSLAYVVKVGHLRLELFEIELKAAKVKRMTELIQKSLYLSQSYSLMEIEKAASDELETSFLNLDFMRLNLKKDLEIAKDPGSDVPQDLLNRLKSSYRVIVKKLHPDVHPNQSAKEKDLFAMATEAYKAFDIEALEEITAVLENTDEPSRKSQGEDPDEEREISRLQGLIERLKTKIAEIKDSHPYDKLRIIGDPMLLNKEREGFLRRIEEEKARLMFYEERLKNMLGGGHDGQTH
jgi:hypothetical protein